MAAILVKNGRLLDPQRGIDKTSDLYLEDGKIVALKTGAEKKADRVIDAKGCWVMPGLIDMHVHLRDPGQTEKEDIISGAHAAAAGGFTTIIAMPNTKPVIDRPDRVQYVMRKAEKTVPVHVLQAGAVTVGQKGEELADIAGMVEAGIPAISEDGRSVMNAELCREAMRIASREGIPFLDHCEDANLVAGGCVNADAVQEKEGLPGISNAVEDVIIARDILLAKETGAQLHLCHCSTEASAFLLKTAKDKGIRVTGEVCPHHFTLISADRLEGDTNYKMNPPLRTEKDRDALRRGLKEGIFDVISTDHAPHTAREKMSRMEEAPFGVVGLETAVALTVTELVKKRVLTPLQMAEKMSGNPARILKLKGQGTLEENTPADITIIDPEAKYRIDAASFASKGRNTPFDGREVCGRVLYTIVDGQVAYEYRK